MSDDGWRPTVPYICVPCPTCCVRVGMWCDSVDGPTFHGERIAAADAKWPPVLQSPPVDPRDAQIATLRAALIELADWAMTEVQCSSQHANYQDDPEWIRARDMRALATGDDR